MEDPRARCQSNDKENPVHDVRQEKIQCAAIQMKKNPVRDFVGCSVLAVRVVQVEKNKLVTNIFF